jgi:PD-(D/E)XK endonuclease
MLTYGRRFRMTNLYEGLIDMGGITIWAMAEKSESKAKSKGTDKSVRHAHAGATSKAAGEGARSTLTAKQLGEIAEAEFIAKAVGMGFVVAKPWGDSEPYDFIVNPKKSFIFWRVQVKSAHVVGADGGCSFRAHDHEQKSYSSENIDALVAYARPMKAWYVMPVKVVEELKSLMLYPESRGKRSRFERWREDWEIFRRVVRRGRK